MSVSDASRRISIDPDGWLDEHGDFLFASAVSIVKRADVAEELVQETLLAALRGRQSFEGRSTLRTWLYAILKRKVAEHLRQRSRQVLNDEQLNRWADQQFTRSGKWKVAPKQWPPDAAELVQNEDFKKVLSECLSRMPQQHAEAVVLADHRNLTLEQISKILGTTTTNVGVILHRTRLALRHCLERKWFGSVAAESRGRAE
jgi:RNA polymerase sigma-70 factor, ECF subfamily